MGWWQTPGRRGVWRGHGKGSVWEWTLQTGFELGMTLELSWAEAWDWSLDSTLGAASWSVMGPRLGLHLGLVTPDRERSLKPWGNYDLSGWLKETAQRLRERDYRRSSQKVQGVNMEVGLVENQEQWHQGSGVCLYSGSWQPDWRM